jgi:hypothetical protein
MVNKGNFKGLIVLVIVNQFSQLKVGLESSIEISTLFYYRLVVTEPYPEYQEQLQ